MFNVLRRFFTTEIAQAHCDVPCGVYDPSSALVATKRSTNLSAARANVDLARNHDQQRIHEWQ